MSVLSNAFIVNEVSTLFNDICDFISMNNTNVGSFEAKFSNRRIVLIDAVDNYGFNYMKPIVNYVYNTASKIKGKENVNAFVHKVHCISNIWGHYIMAPMLHKQ